MRGFKSLLAFVFVFAGWAIEEATAEITQEARGLYSRFQAQVYQVRVIVLATGKKAAIGSGFLVSPDGFQAGSPALRPMAASDYQIP